MFLLLLALACAVPEACAWSATPSSSHRRSFRFVEYGEGTAACNKCFIIACDGRVPGADLEVSHWNGNDTPKVLYADTSTEMALKLRELVDRNDDEGGWFLPQCSSRDVDTALVVNNHYDTDGVCSVFALLCDDTEVLRSHADLLVEAAESGDFDEWTTDRGLKLELILSSFCDADEGQAYERALEEFPSLLRDMAENEGASYKELWKDGFDHACQDYEEIKAGNVHLEKFSNHMVVVHEATSTSRVSPYALSRGLKDQGLWEGTSRILRVNQKKSDEGMIVYRYSYEKIGHGWVNKLVKRHMVPSVNEKTLVKTLNEKSDSMHWSEGGPSGLVAICQTREWTALDPTRVARYLAESDEGCQDSIHHDGAGHDDTTTAPTTAQQPRKSYLQRFAIPKKRLTNALRDPWRAVTGPVALAGWTRLVTRGGVSSRCTSQTPLVAASGHSMALVMALSGGAALHHTTPASNVWILPALVCATAYASYNLFIKKASSSTSAPIDPMLGGVLLQLVAAVMGASLYLWKRLTTTAKSTPAFSGGLLQNGGVGWSVAAGIAVGVAEILSFIISGMGVPASKSIPTIVGGSVVVGTLAGSVWLKEKLSIGGWIGVLFIAVGIALVGMDPGSFSGGH
jgi:transporter family protein